MRLYRLYRCTQRATIIIYYHKLCPLNKYVIAALQGTVQPHFVRPETFSKCVKSICNFFSLVNPRSNFSNFSDISVTARAERFYADELPLYCVLKRIRSSHNHRSTITRGTPMNLYSSTACWSTFILPIQ